MKIESICVTFVVMKLPIRTPHDWNTTNMPASLALEDLKEFAYTIFAMNVKSNYLTFSKHSRR